MPELQFSKETKDVIAQLVRSMLPQLANKVIQEEIQRIREEEMTLPAGEELASLIRDAFAPRVDRMTREMVRELVKETIPDIAERLVREEIDKLKNK